MTSHAPATKLPNRLVLEAISEPASHRFSSNDSGENQKRFLILDPVDKQTWGFVVVDNTVRGPGLGGIRIAPDLTMNEVGRLAHAMTLKNSAACLPYGGAKAGLIFDPQSLAANPELKKDLIHLLAEALFDLPTYIPAPDMGTNDRDVQQIFDRYSEKLGTRQHKRGGASRLPETGGIPIDGWGLTAHSMYAAIKTLETIQDDFTLAGSRVVIQGFGNVGAPVAEKLAQEGANIVGVSDVTQAIYNSSGFDLNMLLAARERGGLAFFKGKIEKSFGPKQLDWLLEAPCDLLIPAARPDAITARNADRIDCRMVIQGANAPSNRLTEYYLENRRGILNCSDFIVNVGGVMGCAVELEMTVDTNYRKKVLAEGNYGRPYVENLIYNTVAKNVTSIMGSLTASKADRTFREEALDLAEKRLQQAELTIL